MAEATDVIQKYADSQGLSILEARQKLQKLNEDFNDLYVDGVFSSSHIDKITAHRSMGSAFKNDPLLFRAFDTFRVLNGDDGVKESLKSADNAFGVGNIMRYLRDSVEGTNYETDAETAMMDAYGFTQGSDGSWSEPWTAKQGAEAASEAVKNATPQSDAEIEAAKKKAEAEAAAPKTLDQPEGGAAPAQPAGPTGAGQRIKDLNDAAQSLPANVPLGTGGATTGNRARMNMQAEANRQIGDLIKQQRKQSDQNNFLRDRYDATDGRRAGAWDRLSDQQKDEAVSNYRNRSYSDDSNPFVQQQYNDLMASGYTPPKADIQSQYEAASMNPPSVASADGTATTEEFGSMSPAQQRAFIQNYKYNPQGQSPETVEEGTMMGAQASSNPEVNLETLTVPQGQREVAEYQTSNQTVPGQYMPPERVYPAPDSTLEGGRGGIDVSESFKQNPALQTDGSGNILPPPDGPGDDITTYSPPDVSNLPPIEDVFSKLPEAPQKPQTPYSPPDVSNLPPIEDVFSKLPEAPGRPQQEPAPAPASRAPTPPPTQPKPQGQSPVYGKKDDGTYGVVGYRDNREMKKGMGGTRIKEWTASMDRDRREDDFMNRARQGQVSNPLNSEYNRALGQQNEDAFAKRRAQQAEFARKSAREKELAAMPTPRANAAMDIMNGLPQADQVGIVNQYRKRRGEKPIFNPYSA
jgi:hypothetical protein